MLHLLLVDNEKAILDALIHTLNWDELGFENVDVAEDGQAAWEMSQKKRYDLIISDIRMPQMSGLDLLRLVSRSGMKTRVIILTAFDQFDYVLQALRLGACNYLMKPIDPAELRASVVSALNGTGITSPKEAADKPVFEEYFLRRWLLDGEECRDLDTRSVLAGVNIFLRTYNVLLLRADARLIGTLPERICERLNETCESWMLQERPGEYAIVAGGRNTSADELIGHLVCMEKEFEDTGAVLIVGECVSAYTDVSDCYRACLLALSFRMHESNRAGIVKAADCDDEAGAEWDGKAGWLPDEKDDPDTPGALNRITADRAKESEGADIPHESDSMSPVVRRAAELISSQYAQPLSLSQIAERLGTNANYLGFMFRQETGQYFSDYLNGIRIQAAQQLLRETDQTVNSVAAEVGYSSVNYFCQVFKKITNQSPARFRGRK